MSTKFTLLFLAIFFCFSCAHLPEIEKRHYRNGFYIGKNNNSKSITAKDSVDQKTPAISFVKAEAEKSFKVPDSVKFIESSIPITKKTIHTKKKIQSAFIPKPIELPAEEPINKKAKTAIVFLLLAKVTMLAAFVILLCSLLNVFFILTGIAALFALLAIVFGLWAKKEIAGEEGINKELGAKEADEVVKRAAGGLIGTAFIILLAMMVDWIMRRNGH
jgi:uncharacterized ion transporter superfamily protein YfcC